MKAETSFYKCRIFLRAFKNGRILCQDSYSQIICKNKNLKFLTFIEFPVSSSCWLVNVEKNDLLLKFWWLLSKDIKNFTGKCNTYTFKRLSIIWTEGSVLTVTGWMEVSCTWIMLYFKSRRHVGINAVCTDFVLGNFFLPK